MFTLLAERALIDAALAGDSSAVEQLLLGHFSTLERHLAPKIPPNFRRHFAVEDVLQDVFVQVFRDIDQFDSNCGGSFISWLKVVADHRLADALKHVRRKKRGGDHHQLSAADVNRGSSIRDLVNVVCQDSGTPSRAAAKHEAAEAIQVAIAALPKNQRSMLWAYAIEGRTIEQIAQESGRTEGAVRGLVYRAQKRVAEIMGRASRWLSRQ